MTRYVDLARTNNFDAVLTISNQITASPTEVPIQVDARLKKVGLRHLSWWQVMTIARVEHKHRGISDPDQAWILGELIAYLDTKRLAPAVRGHGREVGSRPSTVPARERFGRRTLVRVTSRGAGSNSSNTCSRSHAGSRARGRGALAEEGRRRGAARRRRRKTLVDDGKLAASLRVPGAVGPIDLEADLRTRLYNSRRDPGPSRWPRQDPDCVGPGRNSRTPPSRYVSTSAIRMFARPSRPHSKMPTRTRTSCFSLPTSGASHERSG